MTALAHENPSTVSSIDLFFDLVFVFVITQVTQLVEHAHGAMDFLRALLVLVPIWWMYAGYAWLTNNVRVTWQMRLVLIARKLPKIPRSLIGTESDLASR